MCAACTDEARALPLADLVARVNTLPYLAWTAYLSALGRERQCLLSEVTADDMPVAVALLVDAEMADRADREAAGEATRRLTEEMLAILADHAHPTP